jgi:hypothetical protein
LLVLHYVPVAALSTRSSLGLGGVDAECEWRSSRASMCPTCAVADVRAAGAAELLARQPVHGLAAEITVRRRCARLPAPMLS